MFAFPPPRSSSKIEDVIFCDTILHDICFDTVHVSELHRTFQQTSNAQSQKNFVKSIATKRMIRVSGKARDRRTMESNNKCLIVA